MEGTDWDAESDLLIMLRAYLLPARPAFLRICAGRKESMPSDARMVRGLLLDCAVRSAWMSSNQAFLAGSSILRL